MVGGTCIVQGCVDHSCAGPGGWADHGCCISHGAMTIALATAAAEAASAMAATAAAALATAAAEAAVLTLNT